MFEFITSWFKTEPVSPEILANINTTITSHKIVVYSKSYCPYCTSTKQLFQQLNQDFKVIELDHVNQGSVIQRGLKEITGQGTVPNIFINGKQIGGNSDLQDLHGRGKLMSLLA
ncbi:Glutaredoxin-C6 [Spathaspora sp. JA1]|nr:Glutaredoxin-C6 [Spathaspora sp. JA1]